jgi:hypothetical protein
MTQSAGGTVSLFECFAVVMALAFQLAALLALLRQPLAG